MNAVIRSARTLAGALKANAQNSAEARAVIDAKGIHTYEDMWRDVCVSAAALSALGVPKGGRVVMECTQDAFFLSVNLSCQLVRAVLCRRGAPRCA